MNEDLVGYCWFEPFYNRNQNKCECDVMRCDTRMAMNYSYLFVRDEIALMGNVLSLHMGNWIRSDCPSVIFSVIMTSVFIIYQMATIKLFFKCLARNVNWEWERIWLTFFRDQWFQQHDGVIITGPCMHLAITVTSLFRKLVPWFWLR